MNTSRLHQRSKKKTHLRSAEPSVGTPLSEGISLVKDAALGVGIAFTVALILLLPATWIVSQATDPLAWIAPLALGILCMAAIAAGCMTRQLHRHAPITCGLLSGAFLLVLCMVLSLFLPSSEQASGRDWWIRLLVPMFAVMGAHIGHFRPKGRRRRRR